MLLYVRLSLVERYTLVDLHRRSPWEKLDHLRNVLLKHSRLYDITGVDVQLVRKEGSALEKLECLHPDHIFSQGTNFGFQTALKRRYYAASVLKGELIVTLLDQK